MKRGKGGERHRERDRERKRERQGFLNTRLSRHLPLDTSLLWLDNLSLWNYVKYWTIKSVSCPRYKILKCLVRHSYNWSLTSGSLPDVLLSFVNCRQTCQNPFPMFLATQTECLCAISMFVVSVVKQKKPEQRSLQNHRNCGGDITSLSCSGQLNECENVVRPKQDEQSIRLFESVLIRFSPNFETLNTDIWHRVLPITR